MDPTIPKAAALLLNFIYATETGFSGPECYNVIFAHRQTKLTRPLTELTLDEVQDSQKIWNTLAWAKRFSSKKASSAAGAAQFMLFTLNGLIKELKLSGSQLFDANLQDRLAFHLLKRRGYNEFISGKITITEFGKRLAQEWASFPVLENCKGAHRQLVRGQSYYAGDSLNKALIKAEEVESILKLVMQRASMPLITKVDPVILDYPKVEIPFAPTEEIVAKRKGTNLSFVIGAAIGYAVLSLWDWVSAAPCNVFGWFCGG